MCIPQAALPRVLDVAREMPRTWLETPEHVICTEFQDHRVGIGGDRSVQSRKVH
jgi:hypothetical protein